MEHFTTLPAFESSGASRYPLGLLDLLVMNTLNPSKNDLTQLDEEISATISAEVEAEETRLQLFINSQIFGLGKKNEIELLVRLYHSSLVILIDQCLKSQKKLPQKSNTIKSIYNVVLGCLEGLLSFIEDRFSEYLGLETKAPSNFLNISQRELKKRIDKLKVKLKRYNIPCASADIVMENLEEFLNQDANNNLTFRNVVYYKDLVTELEKLNCQLDRGNLLPKIDEVLIYMNFNSRKFVKYLIGSITQKVEKNDDPIVKLDRLKLYRKSFSLIHPRQGAILNTKYSGVQDIIGSWFSDEINYLEDKMQYSSLSLPEQVESKPEEKPQALPISKVRVDLSSDQTGLILRAADEARILVSRSLSEVFKTIVPHLSTPHKEELSYKGMRTQSYVAEERDKDIAIGALEKIIMKIKEY